VSSADARRLLMLCATASNAAVSLLNARMIQSNTAAASVGAIGKKNSDAQTARNAACRLLQRKANTAPTAVESVLVNRKWAALGSGRKQQSAEGLT